MPRCGVEISSDAVKYVVLQGRRLVGYGRVPLGEIGGPGAVLRSLREQGKLPTTHLRVALGTQTSILRMLSLPSMPARDLARVVAGEVAKELQIFPEEMATGYLPLPRPPAERRPSGKPPASALRPGLIALTPRAGLRALEGELASCGFHLDLLTTTSLGFLGHVCSLRELTKSGEAAAVLHVGSDRMVLAVVHGGRFRQLRDLASGFDASLLVPYEATGSDGAQVDWDALDQIGRGLDEVTQVARQIRRTLEADAPAHGGEPIRRLLLTGDATRGQAMAPLLQNEVGLPVEVLDPLRPARLVRVEPGFAEEAASYALPLALARASRGGTMLHLGSPRAPAPPAAWWGAALVLALASLAVGEIVAPIQDRVQALGLLPRAHAPSARETEMDWARASGAAPRLPLEWLGRNLPVEAQAARMDCSLQGADWAVRFEGTVRHPSAQGRLSAWTALADSLALQPRIAGANLLPLAGEQPSLRDGSPVTATFRYRVRP